MRILRFNEKFDQNFYSEIGIEDFIEYLSNDDKHSNQIVGNINIGVQVDININRSQTDINQKITEFSNSDISEIKSTGLEDYNYSFVIEDKFIGIKDMDYTRSSINNSFVDAVGKERSKGNSFGNTDYIWIYKTNDDWFFVVFSRSNVIPFHKNRFIMANRNSNIEFYKCDQIDGLISIINDKIIK